ncbi:hypothetical protein SAMN05421783_12811 [Thiocapsa roseopersicina]|uniref:Fibronectin type-III domain-containing protein n=1 Tax=Thiocapsa roseopersicina TaxID=1058 RepID=A0A1H3BX88_THIRO|nr:hypothetical protein SAMN05421783_12811 [Thiocapsa roseopersicina]
MLGRAAAPKMRLLRILLGSSLGLTREERGSPCTVRRGRRGAARRAEPFLWALIGFAFAGGCFGADVRLTWNPVNDPRASRYQVHFGQASRTYAGSVDTTETTAVIGGLTPGQLHYLAVRACTRDGLVCSEFSNEVIAAIAADGEALPVEPCWACLPNEGGWRATLN